nr:PQQ-binding-like beta-propeller repeat protein [Halorussus sp. JP-T4]
MWRFAADSGPNGGLFTPPVCDGERVYAGCDDGRLYAVADGEAAWSRSLDRLPNRIAGAGDALFVGTYGGDGRPSSLSALDAATGETRWQIGYDDEVRGISVAGGTVYATVVTDRQPGGDITGTTVYAYG